MARWRLSEVNRLDAERFVEEFGDVVEGNPWVAEAAAHQRPFACRDDVHRAFCNALREVDRGAKLAVIRAHPDLGAKLDALSAASQGEQAGAGLDRLSPTQRDQFRELNEAYRVKFGFPFIFAVKGAAPADVLAAFEARLPNDLETEFATALDEVETIVAFRLEDRIEEA